MRKGFTLIELLVVIAIVAVLAVAVVLVLNPAELIKQGRDATRIADFGTVQSAIAYMLSTDESIPTFTAGPFCSFTGCSCATTAIFTAGPCTARSKLVATDGSGWIAVDLSGAQGGSPLAKYPLDPTNNTTNYYAYVGGGASPNYEIDTKLESVKYSGQMDSDGGNQALWYEVGNVTLNM